MATPAGNSLCVEKTFFDEGVEGGLLVVLDGESRFLHEYDHELHTRVTAVVRSFVDSIFEHLRDASLLVLDEHGLLVVLELIRIFDNNILKHNFSLALTHRCRLYR